jgi:hypothetical protein
MLSTEVPEPTGFTIPGTVNTTQSAAALAALRIPAYPALVGVQAINLISLFRRRDTSSRQCLYITPNDPLRRIRLPSETLQ